MLCHLSGLCCVKRVPVIGIRAVASSAIALGLLAYFLAGPLVSGKLAINDGIVSGKAQKNPEQLAVADTSVSRRMATAGSSSKVNRLSNPFSVTEIEATAYASGTSVPVVKHMQTTEQSEVPNPLSSYVSSDLSSELALYLSNDLSNEIALQADSFTIEFMFSPVAGMRYVPDPVMLTKNHRVYGRIMPLNDCANCVLVWRHQASGNIAKITNATFKSEESHLIYLTPELGWRKGRYELSIVEMGSSPQLLTHASINVSNVLARDAPNEPDNLFIQTLLNTGRLVSKQQAIDSPKALPESPNRELMQQLLDSGRAVAKSK